MNFLRFNPVNTDKKATKDVVEYVLRYAGTRGSFPRIVVSAMRELNGWPVYNTDERGNIAFFTTQEAAEKAIRTSKNEYRNTFGVDWFKDIR